MVALKGAVSLNDILKMPLKQYLVLKNQVDIVVLENRKTFIHDTAMAFSEPKKAIADINETLKELTKSKSNISWEADKGAVQRAKRKYMRN